MSVLMFINIKGGVAKTTNSIAVAQCLAERGKRVLVIDADHQCAASELLMGQYRLERSEHNGTTLHDLLSELVKEQFRSEDYLQYIVGVSANLGREWTGSLSVLPCSLRMDDYHRNYFEAREKFGDKSKFLTTRNARLKKLRDWLHVNFEYVIIDCPPSMPLQVQLLVRTADSYVVPCIPERLSIRGAQYLLDRLRRKNFKIRGLGTLWSLVRAQNQIHVDNINAAKKERLFPGMPEPFTVVIPNATAIARAFEATDEPVTNKYPRDVADRFSDLVNEILERCESVPARV